MSKGESTLALHIRASKLPTPIREYEFHTDRKWRFDFCWPDQKLAVEIDGGNRVATIIKGKAVAVGRHTQDADYSKLNAATLAGYQVLRFTPTMVKSGEAIDTLLKILKQTV